MIPSKFRGLRSLPRTALLLALLLSGCGSPVNQENFNRIQAGMTQEEVEAILGKPDESSIASLGGFTGGTLTWKSDDATISVQFMNGKVQFKQFAKGGEKAQE